MNKKAKISSSILLGLTLALTGCNTNAQDSHNSQKQEQTAKESKQENKLTAGQELTKILSGTNWQGTKVYDKNNNDLTKENANFIGLAKYDDKHPDMNFLIKIQKKVVVIRELSLLPMGRCEC
jgi:hypothetical protein